MRHRFYIKRSKVQEILDINHLTHRGFAKDLDLSPSHWSLLFNGKRQLTPSVRRKLIQSPLLEPFSESDIWNVVLAEA
jgi:hypothetical protein